MTTPNQLPVVYEQVISPKMFTEEIEAAAAKAKTLRSIVEGRQLAVKIGASEHLKVEGWQIIAAGYGYTCGTTIREIKTDESGTVLYVVATATVYDRLGTVRGHADQVCFANEDGKAGQGVSQLAGMAQTRAESRALKQVFSWVAELAGYNPTTAEEMTGVLAIDPHRVCPLHEVEWFKRGKMTAYSHPVEGASGPRGGKVWCNMEDVLGDLSARMKQVATKQEWDRDTIAEWGTRWKNITPKEKLVVLQEFETSTVPNHPDDPAEGANHHEDSDTAN